MKRVVRLRNRETGEINTYPTVSDLCERNGDTLGISRQALYNALHVGRGLWENKNYMVYYENIELGQSVWR